jgi:hypothetical protein
MLPVVTLSFVMLSVIMLSAIMPIVIMPIVVMPIVVMLSVIMPCVVAPAVSDDENQKLERRYQITPLVSQVPSFMAKTASCLNPIVFAISHPK